MCTEFPAAFTRTLHELPGPETAALLEALRRQPPVSIRYNRRKQLSPVVGTPVVWCGGGVYLDERPVFTLDPLLHAGAYYVQEASSMFLAQCRPLIQAFGNRCRVLDLCAAPGGKSTLLAGLLPDDALLVGNEVIRTRTPILQENLSKWGFPNTVITSADPQRFGALGAFFDVLLIDAPCSGEGLFRKDPAAMHAWSPAHVSFCADRQRRIVADAWGALREGGLLLYSTCTFNRCENEENVAWIAANLGAERMQLPLNPAWGIVESEWGYRFYPHKVQGEGFFISALRKTSAASPTARKGSRHAPDSVLKGSHPAKEWLSGEFILEERNRYVQALPAVHHEAIGQLQAALPVVQAGVPVGEQKGRDLLPAAPLALSTACRQAAFTRAEVDLPTALRYLRRENIHPAGAPDGQLLVCYGGLPLGFAKKIGTRTNNGYPLSWRIRMGLPR